MLRSRQSSAKRAATPYYGPEPGVYPSADWPAGYGSQVPPAPYGSGPGAFGGPPNLPVGMIYDWTTDTIWAPDDLAATALDGTDGKYDRTYFGTKIKVIKKKQGQLVYPGKPSDYAQGLVPPVVMKPDIYTKAGAQPGAPVYDPYKDVIYAPDAVTATALDLQDGGVNSQYHGTAIKVKKGKAMGYAPYYPLAAKQPLVHGYPVPGTTGHSGGGYPGPGGYSAVGGATPYGPAFGGTYGTGAPEYTTGYGPAAPQYTTGGAYGPGAPEYPTGGAYGTAAPNYTAGGAHGTAAPQYTTGGAYDTASPQYTASPAAYPPQPFPAAMDGNYTPYSPGAAAYRAGDYLNQW